MANPVDIISEGSAEEPAHGGVIVTQASQALAVAGLARGRIAHGILIRAPGPDDDTPNTKPVYVGAPRVTGDQNVRTAGTALPPGASITLPCLDPSKVFVVTASGDNQFVTWIGV